MVCPGGRDRRADGWCEISRGESGQGVQGAFDILATIIEGVAKLHAAAVVRRIVSLVQTQPWLISEEMKIISVVPAAK